MATVTRQTVQHGKYTFENVISGMTLQGTEELTQTLSRLNGLARQSAKLALYSIANKIMEAAKLITPVSGWAWRNGGWVAVKSGSKGNLRASGQVQNAEEHGDTVSVTMGFGNSAVKYAIFVHERLGLRHRPPTKAKFLEEPLLAMASTIESRMAVEIRKDLEAMAAR